MSFGTVNVCAAIIVSWGVRLFAVTTAGDAYTVATKTELDPVRSSSVVSASRRVGVAVVFGGRTAHLEGAVGNPEPARRSL